MEILVTLVGELTNEDVFRRIDAVLEDRADRKPLGIRVSNSLHIRGIQGEYRGIPIAMDPRLYPKDQVEVVFQDE